MHGSTDEAVWVKFDKGFFNVQNDMVLCVCYIPPTNSSSQSHRENDAFDSLILDMAKFKDTYRDAIFLVCCDMNGRTGNAPDHLVDDNSSYLRLPDNYVEDTELWRVNEDHIINTQGRNILDMCKMCDLRILNEMCGADKGHGRFTCTTYNGNSVVDYVLCSSRYIDYICDFRVCNQN